MNTDTYQSALESTKDSIEDVNKAIGFSLGSLGGAEISPACVGRKNYASS